MQSGEKSAVCVATVRNYLRALDPSVSEKEAITWGTVANGFNAISRWSHVTKALCQMTGWFGGEQTARRRSVVVSCRASCCGADPNGTLREVPIVRYFREGGRPTTSANRTFSRAEGHEIRNRGWFLFVGSADWVGRVCPSFRTSWGATCRDVPLYHPITVCEARNFWQGWLDQENRSATLRVQSPAGNVKLLGYRLPSDQSTKIDGCKFPIRA